MKQIILGLLVLLLLISCETIIEPEVIVTQEQKWIDLYYIKDGSGFKHYTNDIDSLANTSWIHCETLQMMLENNICYIRYTTEYNPYTKMQDSNNIDNIIYRNK